MTFIALLIFVILTVWELKLFFTSQVEWRMPYGSRSTMLLSGKEALIILMFATAYIGLAPVLSLRLGFLELLCIVGALTVSSRVKLSWPMWLFMIFIAWEVIGLTYAPSVSYGIRMILKYTYPFLFAIFAARVVKDGVVMVSAAIWARRVATVAVCLTLIPPIRLFVSQFFWFDAALTTSIITMAIFSFAMVEFSDEKKKNLWWGIFFCLPCLILVFRTDIFGTVVAIATFFVLKYRTKGLPIAAALGILGLCSMFYVPAVKNKMFFRPDEVSMVDYVTGNYDKDNVRMNGRKDGWKNVENWFYKNHEEVGSGTGRVQYYFYEEAIGWQRRGQLHNDFLVLKCDNGMIGLILFGLSYFAVTLHCIYLYHKSRNTYTRMAAMVAGASLMGVFVTMYSDNTLSYSMCTLSFPWGFYGMALGIENANGEDAT